MKAVYKYPQSEFPYRELVQENQRRSSQEPPFELIDTGVFDESKYFDIQMEYAKCSTEDMLIKCHVTNRGKEPATLHLLPTVWVSNY
jgi:hypothetical protein